MQNHMAPCVKWTANAHVLRNNSPAAKAGYHPSPRALASQEESSDSQRKHSLQLVIDEELTDKCFENGSSLSIVLFFSHAQVPQSNSPSVTVKDQIWMTPEAWLFSTLYGTYPGEMWDQKGSARQLPVYFLKQDCTPLGTLQRESMGLSHRWQQPDLTLSQSSVSAFVSFFPHGCCPHFIHWALR